MTRAPALRSGPKPPRDAPRRRSLTRNLDEVEQGLSRRRQMFLFERRCEQGACS